MLHDPAKAHNPDESTAHACGPEPPVRPAVPPPVQDSLRQPSPVEVASEAGARDRLLAVTGERIQGVSSFFISLMFHTGLLVALAVMMAKPDQEMGRVSLVIGPANEETESLTQLEMATPDQRLDRNEAAPFLAADTQLARTADAPNIASPFAGPATGGVPTKPAAQAIHMDSHDWLIRVSVPVGGGYEGRTQDQRARLVGQRGGTAASENAVELGLAWLAAHQRRDGGWRLNHREGPCQGRCRNPGTVGTSTGATALALLPFLGAGYTHKQGKYQEVVERGLYYLTSRMLKTRHGGDLQEGTMYAQGLATMTLCEAYAMSGDEHLGVPAQEAIDFICAAQHSRGGWRYLPGHPGDTTVTGWQVMALKSGRLAGLYVPSPVTEMVKQYLNSVQDGGGAFYGYQHSEKERGPTSVGLLLRMYLGWSRTDERLGRGVNYLANLGPSKTDMYFNYYATQVLHHYEGYLWQRWNEEMRDYLVHRQARNDHERGSWFFPDSHGTVGGRLYTTSMCIMILEVYYRHMPLYGSAAVEDAF
ncbi:MAG: hypothetical protein ACC628_23490 [Pirellulaceae bacterium]